MRGCICGKNWRRALFAAALALSGCGEEHPRHQISGTVTYQGKPVEMGVMKFEADASVGNVAPYCYARIEDGKYETELEESPTTGKYQVQVIGIDKANIKRDVSAGPKRGPDIMPPLFPTYTTSIEVPPPDGKFDVDVPSAPANAKGARGAYGPRRK
jgi:hypothetical protein